MKTTLCASSCGCSVPVVLRETKGRSIKGNAIFKIIGEAYIHGMMDGAAVLDDGTGEEADNRFILR